MSRLQGETRELTVVLTAEELEDRGADLAAAVRHADQEEAHMEGRKAAWREELKGLKEDVASARSSASKLAEIVRTGKDKRDVTCTWKYALSAGWAFLVRDDTGERIASRKLKDEERQLSLNEPPFAEPTPEELEEWLRTLPVNEEPEPLPEGHADEVTSGDRAVDLAEEEFEAYGDDVGIEDAREFYDEECPDDDPASDTEEEILEQEINDAIVTDEHGEPLEEPIPVSTTPRGGMRMGLNDLVRMTDEEFKEKQARGEVR